MSRAAWQGWLQLALLPLLVTWWFWVLLPCWILVRVIRYRRTPAAVRQRHQQRRQYRHHQRARFWIQYEQETRALLIAHRLMDTPENRAKLRR